MSQKYGNRKVTLDGRMFDSQREARRYAELKWLLRAGEISNLQCQVAYELIPQQRDTQGKVVERPVKYIADFVYQEKNGNTVVEDVKGMRTKEFIIKRKLMLWRHGIRVIEI
ncbi:MAG: DUF1064 domain-containing protein [Clostridia bacterium]|nr:DUF1064 domain-containing protein [Clostridia bacterium]